MHITAKLKRELVQRIDPEKKYPVDYTIRQDGTKVPGKTEVLGKELTENQTVSLWENGLI